MSNQGVLVKFLKEWMGNPEGSLKLLKKQAAIELINRGTVKMANEKNIEEPEENKMIDAPEQNKMIASPIVKKNAGRKRKVGK